MKLLTMAALLAASSFSHAAAVHCHQESLGDADAVRAERDVQSAQGPLERANALYTFAAQKAAAREPTYAMELADQAIALWRAEAATPELAAALRQRALVLGIDNCALTAPLLRTALAISERASGADHAQTVTVLADLVRADIARRDDKALALEGARLMAAWAAGGEPADDIAAPVYRRMIDLYFQQRQYAQAEPLALRNLQNGEQAHGKEAAALVLRLDDLASVYYGQLRYSEGAALTLRAETIAVKTDPDSVRAKWGRQVDAERTMRKLFSEGDVAGAIATGQRELKRQEQLLEQESVTLAKAIQAREAATGTEQLTKLNEAVTHARLDVEGSDKKIGAMRVRLAELYHHQRRYDLAEPLYQQALVSYTQAQADALDVAQARSSLAMLYRARAEYQRALPLQQQALDAMLPAYGAAHPDVIDSARELALLHQRLNQPEAAAALAARVPAIAR